MPKSSAPPSPLFTAAAPSYLHACDRILSEQIGEDERYNTPHVVPICVARDRINEEEHFLKARSTCLAEEAA